MAELLPGIPLVMVGLLVLLFWRRIADFFTEVQQRDKHFASPDAGFFQRLNTALFGIMPIAMGLYDLNQQGFLS